jgi:hypothetical protein
MKVRISRAQQRIVDAMKTGWFLATSHTGSGSAFISNHGTDIEVSTESVDRLIDKGIIELEQRGVVFNYWRLKQT